jgi:hypothetical protein
MFDLVRVVINPKLFQKGELKQTPYEHALYREYQIILLL